MKSLFTFFLIVTVFSVSAQDGVIVKYYDSILFSSSKEKAYYYTKFIKEDSLYKSTTYYADSNKLYSKAIYKDTFHIKAIGSVVTYYRSGKIKDSCVSEGTGEYTFYVEYYESGKVKDTSNYDSTTKEYDTKYYYESGKLQGHCFWDNKAKKIVDVSFDESGKLIEGYIHKREASFPGGRIGWKEFLIRHLNSNVPGKHKSPVGRYSVYISLSIGKDGKVNDILAENDPGYGTKEEAIRVIKKSPKWDPAIENNIPIAYHARQSITFVVSDN